MVQEDTSPFQGLTEYKTSLDSLFTFSSVLVLPLIFKNGCLSQLLRWMMQCYLISRCKPLHYTIEAYTWSLILQSLSLLPKNKLYEAILGKRFLPSASLCYSSTNILCVYSAFAINQVCLISLSRSWAYMKFLLKQQLRIFRFILHCSFILIRSSITTLVVWFSLVLCAKK